MLAEIPCCFRCTSWRLTFPESHKRCNNSESQFFMCQTSAKGYCELFTTQAHDGGNG